MDRLPLQVALIRLGNTELNANIGDLALGPLIYSQPRVKLKGVIMLGDKMES